MSRTIPAALAVLIGVLSSPPLFATPAAAAEEGGAEVLTPDVNPDFEALAAGHRARALDLKSVTTLEGIIWPLSKVRVVYVGESHDRYEQHLNQLEIIRSLHQGKPDLAIGMEFFQWPFQSVLDRYIAGEIDERTFLRETEYYKRWRFDYRLYRPILQYARENRIPVIALNVPAELTRKVAEGGFQSLTPEERASLPAEIDRSDTAYRERLRKIFEIHARSDERSFENFVSAQLLWDEGMAETAANWLRANPGRSMVILAGSGHVMYGSGIPDRLQRRVPDKRLIVLNGVEAALTPEAGDYVLIRPEEELPRGGLMGVFLDDREEGVYVGKLDTGSGAAAAGIHKGDRILSVDGFDVNDYADIKIALLDRKPGDRIAVSVERDGLFSSSHQLDFEVELK
ncbi:ChaN family lipoprotein [Thioalbus denitrificans]|uniref:Putative iron-regulated protein n=1 Tax=Thioalbus denitrificans TaxID=547122 RepID=A0A369CGV0_9GAMM|nr:ChaN family lipoprotein [Thioalbus denitrificans]RCX32305.1 putative iron-regulated protein [Thioalbus denitrificans]